MTTNSISRLAVGIAAETLPSPGDWSASALIATTLGLDTKQRTRLKARQGPERGKAQGETGSGRDKTQAAT